MTTPSDVASAAAGTLAVSGVGWFWTRSRATGSSDSATRAIYQSRAARAWSNLVFGLIAAIALIALVVSAVMAVT